MNRFALERSISICIENSGMKTIFLLAFGRSFKLYSLYCSAYKSIYNLNQHISLLWGATAFFSFFLSPHRLPESINAYGIYIYIYDRNEIAIKRTSKQASKQARGWRTYCLKSCCAFPLCFSAFFFYEKSSLIIHSTVSIKISIKNLSPHQRNKCFLPLPLTLDFAILIRSCGLWWDKKCIRLHLLPFF